MNITVTVVDAIDTGRGFSGADWTFDSVGNLTVTISRLSDPRREALLAIHEVVEAILCWYHGISQATVDRFDAEYEATHDSDLNAGDDAAAPYRREHCFATAIERILAAEFGICWSEYDIELAALPPNAKALEKLRKNGLLK